MTTQEFQRLVDRAAPSDWLRLNWTQYDTEGYAAAFLPQANMRFPDERLRLVDAAELFSSNVKQDVGRAMRAQGLDELFTITVLTVPDGAAAADSRQRIAAASEELVAHFTVRQDDTVRLEFYLGRQVRDVLRQLRQGDPVADLVTMETTVDELDRASAAGFDRLAISRLLAGALNLANSLEKALGGQPEPPTPPFSAGSYKNAGKNAWAHGDIEEVALQRCGYSSLERRKVYYGNWLRDFSQIMVGMLQGFNTDDAETLNLIRGEYQNLPDAFHTDKLQYLLTQGQWTELIGILAVQEFAYKPLNKKKNEPFKPYIEYKKLFEADHGILNADRLGVYRPEEHLDNPKGLRNESIYGDGRLANPVQYEYVVLGNPVVRERRTLHAGLAEEEERNPQATGPLDIDASAKIKRFLLHDIDSSRPSPISYFADQLRLAAAQGRNKDGLRHFGAALHVLEDFYAHSNFVEIALIKSGATKVWPWVKMTSAVEGMEDGPAKAQSIPLTTGFFSSADSIASISAKLAEIVLSTADNPFLSEDDNAPLPNVVGYRSFADVLILHYLSSKESNQRNLKVKETMAGVTYGHLLNLYKAKLALRDELVEQGKSDALWGLWGRFIRGVRTALEEVSDALSFFPQLIVGSAFEMVLPFTKEAQTQQGGDSLDDPSHTQLAKDPPEHPLNDLAGLLATAAVEDIGKGMAGCWKGEDVEALVQHALATYFKHPSHVTWMDEDVASWKTANSSKVNDATIKSRVDHHSSQIEEFLNKTLPDAINAAKNALGL